MFDCSLQRERVKITFAACSQHEQHCRASAINTRAAGLLSLRRARKKAACFVRLALAKNIGARYPKRYRAPTRSFCLLRGLFHLPVLGRKRLRSAFPASAKGDGRGDLLEPVELIALKIWQNGCADLCVIVVQQFHIAGGEHRQIDRVAVVGNERQRLEL